MDKLQQIKLPIDKEFEEFRRLFDSSLQSSNSLLSEVLSYIKQRNGKMMRPILALLIAKLFGEINDSTLHAALSLELLHTASLVHDDVVDESDKRRGQSSVNAIYNNKVSVLVGDYMLATSLKHSAMTREITIVDLVACLGQNLSEGEIIQLANINASEFSEEVYYDVIRKKTAALFTASAEAGAISVHASDEMVKNARLFGEMIGIAFQIKDYIFDYYSSDEIGKPTGNDMREGKLTLPALYVLNMFDDEEMRKLYQKNGMGHLLAISGVKTLKLDIPLVPETRINWAFVPLHIAIIYILKLCLDEEIIPRCRFPCSRGYHKKYINWQKKQ